MNRLPMTPMAQLAALKKEVTESYAEQNRLRARIKELEKPAKVKPKAVPVIKKEEVKEVVQQKVIQPPEPKKKVSAKRRGKKK